MNWGVGMFVGVESDPIYSARSGGLPSALDLILYGVAALVIACCIIAFGVLFEGVLP